MKKITAFLLVLVMAFALCACGSSETESAASSVAVSESDDSSNIVTESNTSVEESAEENKLTFKVTVVTAEGTAVPGVMVQLCKDTCIPAKTDENGVATFNAEITDGYKLSVLSCPAGFIYDGESEIYLESGITEYTIELSEGDAQ